MASSGAGGETATGGSGAMQYRHFVAISPFGLPHAGQGRAIETIELN
jgi:hypothetical protein